MGLFTKNKPQVPPAPPKLGQSGADIVPPPAEDASRFASPGLSPSAGPGPVVEVDDGDGTGAGPAGVGDHQAVAERAPTRWR